MFGRRTLSLGRRKFSFKGIVSSPQMVRPPNSKLRPPNLSFSGHGITVISEHKRLYLHLMHPQRPYLWMNYKYNLFLLLWGYNNHLSKYLLRLQYFSFSLSQNLKPKHWFLESLFWVVIDWLFWVSKGWLRDSVVVSVALSKELLLSEKEICKEQRLALRL